MTLTQQTKRAEVRADSLTVTGPAGDIVRDLSFSLRLGQTLGIVGESGSGKSLTARAVSGLLPAGLRATGTVSIAGTDVSLPGSPQIWKQLRGAGVTLLLQDPFTSLSPTHRCGDQIAWTLQARTKGPGRPTRNEIRALVIKHLTEVNLPATVARRYPGELSGGMRQRAAIAAALAASPRLLIADEPTTALDASNQKDVLDLLASLQLEYGMAMVLISHDLGVVRGVTDEVLVMYAGRVVERGPTAAVLSKPVHPYTAGLHLSDPPMDRRLERLIVIPGRVPEPGHRPAGCSFADRCSMASDVCRVAEPPLERTADGRSVACYISRDPIALAAPAVVEERWHRGDDAPLVRVHNLVKSFAGHLAVENVNIEVHDGESVGIVGESGSGKTTLARCIAGLERPDHGEVIFRGVTLTRERRTANQIQVVFQDPYSALNPRMRVGAAIAEALRTSRSDRTRTVTELLDMVGLPTAFARRYPAELSGGERQRVAIARSLAPDPDLLICDESVSALDVSVQAQILNLLSDLRQELSLSILFISHDLAVVRQVSDAIYVIKGGRIVESGLTRDVLHAPRQDYTRRLITAVSH